MKVTCGDLGSHFEYCPLLDVFFGTLRLRVAFYHMHFVSLYLSNYLNIIFNKCTHANDFEDGEKYKMAATFHILSLIEKFSLIL